MHFLAYEECQRWADRHQYGLDSPLQAARAMPHLEVRFPDQPSMVAFCRLISAALEPRSACLLWVTEFGVWPSSENWHLYYRLRQSYGDRRQLWEAPGHLFLDYEDADFVTYLQLAVTSGWDVAILPALAYGGPATARAFVSHDEFAVLAHRDEATLEEWRRMFKT